MSENKFSNIDEFNNFFYKNVKESDYYKFVLACNTGNMTEIEKYINKNYISGFDEFDKYFTVPSILDSLVNGDFNIAKFLLDNGVDPNRLVYSGNKSNKKTLLFLLIIRSYDHICDKVNQNLIEDDYENVDEMISKSMEEVNRLLENTKSIELLINYGADVNKENEDGYKPLDATFFCGHIPARELLIKYGAINSKKYLK